MIPVLEILLFILLTAATIMALYEKDLLAAVVGMVIFSLISALLFVAMGAVDVGFTEAVVGAGVTGILFIAALFQTSRKSVD